MSDFYRQREFAKSRPALAKVGDTIRILHMEGEPSYAGKEGVVKLIDAIGQLHGTWGGCAVCEYYGDRFEVIKAGN